MRGRGFRAFRWIAPLALAALASAEVSCKRSEGGSGLTSRATALTTPPTLPQFAVYGERSVKLARDVHVNGGDVGVRGRAASTFGAQLRVGQNARVDTGRTLFAPSVSLDANAAVGAVATDSLINNGGTRGTLSAFPASMPPGPLAGSGTPGTTNVTVAANTNRTLDPGNYGTVTANGVVFLKPGNYSFASVTMGTSGQLVAKGPGPTKVLVAGQLVASTRVTIAALTGGASNLTIFVAGNDAAKTAISIGSYSSITAMLAAPHGTLTLADHTDARGAFGGFDVVAGEAVVFTFQAGFPAPPANPPQQLGGYVTDAIAAAPLLRPVPQSTLINFAVGLDLPDRAALVAKVRAVSDPSSASFRQYVTPAQFASTYSPTAAQYQQLQTWAQAQGLTVTKTFDNRLLLDVRGTAAQVGQALSSSLVYRARPNGSEFYSLDREPAVTLAPSAPIYRISGLDNRVVATPGASVRPMTTPGVGSGAGGLYVSRDYRQSYADCTTNTGAGEQVGLFQLDAFLMSDITGFGCGSGLQTCNLAGMVIAGTLPTVTTVLIDGYNGAIQSAAGQAEATIDVQMAMEMAPGLSQIIVYEAFNDGSVAKHNNILNAMAADPTIRQHSSSWFFNTDANTQTILYTMAAQGQSFFQCSGDQGSSSWTTDPGDIRNLDAVTVVGGTILNMNLGPPLAYVSETTWNRAAEGASGGGVTTTAVPDYQAAYATFVGQTGKRVLPDVSMVATDQLGFLNGVLVSMAGTSLAAPLFASWLALANEQSLSLGLAPAGFVNPFLYEVAGAASSIYTASFNDIADASHNAGSCPSGVGSGFCAMSGWAVSTTSTSFTAGAGYDMATGLGTPTCFLLDEVGTSSIKTPGQPDAGPSDAAVDGGADGAEGGAPEAPSLFVVATVGADGVEFCMQGGGFDPGHQIQFRYLDLPNGAASQDSAQAPLIVPSNGRYTNFDPTWGGGPSSVHGFIQFCDAMDVMGNMTVRVIQVDDPSKVATASISNSWICGAMPQQGATNETPLPFPPMFGQTTCPRPPN